MVRSQALYSALAALYCGSVSALAGLQAFSWPCLHAQLGAPFTRPHLCAPNELRESATRAVFALGAELWAMGDKSSSAC